MKKELFTLVGMPYCSLDKYGIFYEKTSKFEYSYGENGNKQNFSHENLLIHLRINKLWLGGFTGCPDNMSVTLRLLS